MKLAPDDGPFFPAHFGEWQCPKCLDRYVGSFPDPKPEMCGFCAREAKNKSLDSSEP